MANLLCNYIKPASPDDYCVDLRLSPSHLLSCFNSSNTIHLHSIPSLQSAGVFQTGSQSVLSEISPYENHSAFWVDRQGTVGLLDFRSSSASHAFSTNEEIFSVDSSGFNLAISTSSKISVFDTRNFQEKKQYQDLFADENDITCVRLSKSNPSLLLSCSEDSLMALCDVESTEEDDYTLVNVEEPALKSGFYGDSVYCVTISKLVCYDVHWKNEDQPPELLFNHKLFEYQSFNPSVGYFIAAHKLSEDRFGESALLGGSHE